MQRTRRNRQTQTQTQHTANSEKHHRQMEDKQRGKKEELTGNLAGRRGERGRGGGAGGAVNQVVRFSGGQVVFSGLAANHLS